MTTRQLFSLSLVVFLIAGLIVTAAANHLAAAPPKHKPGPHAGAKLHPKPPKLSPKPGPKLHHKAHHATAKPGPKPHPKLLPKKMVGVGPKRRHPVVVPRYRSRVVIGRGTTIVGRDTRVIRQVPSAVVLGSINGLAVVPTSNSARTAAYKVVGVADDYTVTLLIDGVERAVRLLGVDPPLAAQSENRLGATPLAAKHFVANLLVAELVQLGYDPDLARKDADGNLVAYLFRAPDGLLVNLEIIRQGYGLSAAGYRFQYEEEFNSYQQKARADGKGIWAARSASSE